MWMHPSCVWDTGIDGKPLRSALLPTDLGAGVLDPNTPRGRCWEVPPLRAGTWAWGSAEQTHFWAKPTSLPSGYD